MVKYKRDKGVSRKDFKAMRSRIKELRKNSDSFKTMFDDLDDRKEKYFYNAVDGLKSDSPTGGNVMNIAVGYTGNDPD